MEKRKDGVNFLGIKNVISTRKCKLRPRRASSLNKRYSEIHPAQRVRPNRFSHCARTPGKHISPPPTPPPTHTRTHNSLQNENTQYCTNKGKNLMWGGGPSDNPAPQRAIFRRFKTSLQLHISTRATETLSKSNAADVNRAHISLAGRITLRGGGGGGGPPRFLNLKGFGP